MVGAMVAAFRASWLRLVKLPPKPARAPDGRARGEEFAGIVPPVATLGGSESRGITLAAGSPRVPSFQWSWVEAGPVERRAS